MKPATLRHEKGVTLIVAMILLVLITMMVTAAFNVSSTNIKSVGNMQFRNEALASAKIAIEEVVSNGFPKNFGMPTSGAPTSVPIPIRQTGSSSNKTADYTVLVGTEVAMVSGHYVESPGSGTWVKALCIEKTSTTVTSTGSSSSGGGSSAGFVLNNGSNPLAATTTTVYSGLFDIKTTVTDPVSGASVEVHDGFRVELDNPAAQCP